MTDQQRTDVGDMSSERRALLERLRRQRQTTSRPAVPTGSSAGNPAISLFFFSADIDDRADEKYEVVLACAELADQLGLHSVWVPERHFDPFGAPYASPGLLLAAIAARTERIGLRAGSVVLPLRDPLLVAEEWGMLDAISGGRAALGIAPGWHADDFVLNPDGYESRKEVLRDRLEQLQRLWAGEGITRTGPGGRAVDVRTFPRPGHVPEVWLTSSSNPATWQTAGDLNLNVLSAMLELTVDELGDRVGQYRKALKAAGHDPADRQITCMLHTHLASDPEDVLPRVTPPLTRYMAAHMNLFAKLAASQEMGVRPEDVTEADRKILLEHGLRRYVESAGLFGSVETCRPMIDRLTAAGVTELGCLVDFGLPPEQVIECVRELGRLNVELQARVSPETP